MMAVLGWRRGDDMICLLLQNRRRIDLRHHHAIHDARYRAARVIAVVQVVSVLVRYRHLRRLCRRAFHFDGNCAR
jgi:hypothetical protein